jgi:hypothetical protein
MNGVLDCDMTPIGWLLFLFFSCIVLRACILSFFLLAKYMNCSLVEFYSFTSSCSSALYFLSPSCTPVSRSGY